MAVVHVTYEANLQAYEKSLRETTDFTEKEIKKQVRAYGKMQKAIQKDNEAAAKSTQKAAGEAGRAVQKNIGAMRKVFEGVQGSLGSTGSRLTALGEAAAVFGPAGIAGLAVAGFAVAVGALVVGVVKVSKAIAGLVSDAADLAVELEDLNAAMDGGLISAAAIESVLDAAEAMNAAETAGKALKIQLASSFSPAVDEAAQELTAFQLATIDTAAELTITARQVDIASKAFRQMLTIASVFSLTAAKVKLVADATDEYEQEAVELTTALANQARIAAELTDQDRKSAAAQKEAAKASREAAKASRDAAKADREAASAARERAAAVASANTAMFGQALKAFKGMQGERAADVKAAEQGEADKAQAAQDRMDDEAAAAAKLAQVKASILDSGIAAAAAVAERLGLDAFRAQQAAAVAGIVVDTIRAAMNWAASVPPPAVPAAIAAAVALGGVQSALVLSAPPPAYHVGGLLGQSSAPNVDETFRTLRNERAVGVVTPQGLNQLNRGEGAGSRTLIIPMHGHKQYNAFMADDLAMSSSTTRRAIKSTRRGRVGHRRRNA